MFADKLLVTAFRPCLQIGFVLVDPAIELGHFFPEECYIGLAARFLELLELADDTLV